MLETNYSGLLNLCNVHGICYTEGNSICMKIIYFKVWLWTTKNLIWYKSLELGCDVKIEKILHSFKLLPLCWRTFMWCLFPMCVQWKSICIKLNFSRNAFPYTSIGLCDEVYLWCLCLNSMPWWLFQKKIQDSWIRRHEYTGHPRQTD